MNEQTDLFENPESRFTLNERPGLPARVVAIGIGGIGCRCIHRMVEARIDGVELVAVDTDASGLQSISAPLKLKIGKSITGHLSCNGNPEVGRKVALEETELILDLINGFDMIFVIGGEGGGAFTGAAPIFAGLAAEIGIISVAMATMPFELQGRTRMKCAEIGLRELKEAADILITPPREDIHRTLDENSLLDDAYAGAEQFFCRAVKDISEILVKPGILNVDLSEMRALMRQNEATFIGTGLSTDSNRAKEAVLKALANPFLEEIPIGESNSALLHVVAARQSLKLHEVSAAAQILKEHANLENVIISAMYDPHMEDEIKVTVIASTSSQAGSEPMRCHVRIPEGSTNSAVLKLEAQKADPPRCIIDWKELDRPAYRRRNALSP